MSAGDMRIADHVVYASKPHVARGFPRAALLVRRELPQSEVDLNDLCTESAEFVAVTVEWKRRPLTIVSVYVAPNAPWDTHVLADIRVRAKGDLIVAGDFNAHSQSWGDKQDSPRGRELQATVEALDLRNITSGSQTFIRPGVTGSVIDLTFTTWSLRLSATPQADSWGSDHLPIVIGRPPKVPLRTCQIVDWDHYRTLLGEALEGGFPFNSETLSRVLKEATRESTKQYRHDNRPIYYLDETWINAGYTRSKVRKDQSVTSSSDAQKKGLTTGLKNNCGKRERFIIVHVGSKEGFVEGVADVFRAKKVGGDYFQEMDGQCFEEQLTKKLLPNLKPRTVIVMDNASHHSVKLLFMPSTSTKKLGIYQWLSNTGITLDLSC
ncbi:hypothetical protein ISCGN_001351 [Ixodes scapularis]